jgi:alanyl-tRNA synthetase
MATMDDFFNQLEAYTNLEPAIIRGTKIYKVLRGVVKLSSIPKEEEYQFKKRSNDLLASWHEALGSKGDEKEDEKVEDNSEKAEKPEETVEKAESKEPTEAPSNTEAAEDKDVAMTDVKEDKVEAAPAADSETAAAE